MITAWHTNGNPEKATRKPKETTHSQWFRSSSQSKQFCWPQIIILFDICIGIGSFIGWMSNPIVDSVGFHIRFEQVHFDEMSPIDCFCYILRQLSRYRDAFIMNGFGLDHLRRELRGSCSMSFKKVNKHVNSLKMTQNDCHLCWFSVWVICLDGRMTIALRVEGLRWFRISVNIAVDLIPCSVCLDMPEVMNLTPHKGDQATLRQSDSCLASSDLWWMLA